MRLKKLIEELQKIYEEHDNILVLVNDTRNGVSDFVQGTYFRTVDNNNNWVQGDILELENDTPYVAISIG